MKYKERKEFFKRIRVIFGVTAVVQWVKAPVLPQLWCWSQLQLGFDSWPGNFHMPWVQQKRKKKKKKKKKKRAFKICKPISSSLTNIIGVPEEGRGRMRQGKYLGHKAENVPKLMKTEDKKKSLKAAREN